MGKCPGGLGRTFLPSPTWEWDFRAGLGELYATPFAPQEASLRFTLPGSGMEGPARQENFILGSSG